MNFHLSEMEHKKLDFLIASCSEDIPLQSRIAPTPSGFLHIGNAFSFLLTWLLVRRTKGTLALRIDDIDKSRKRAEYLEDIFKTLDWLGIDWDKGAESPFDFEKNHSQHLFLKKYKRAINTLSEKEVLFSCNCSRSQIRERTSKLYDGFCLNKNIKNEENIALRIKTQLSEIIYIDDILNTPSAISLHQEIPFFIIQKKDSLPSYQLVSLLEDEQMAINFIVRGKDLLASSAAQLFLAKTLNKKVFLKSKFLHHALVKNKEGSKISKSLGGTSFSIKYFREQGGKKDTFFELFKVWLRKL